MHAESALVVVLLALSALAWYESMGQMFPTPLQLSTLHAGLFVAVWSLDIVAMMIPATAPRVRLYARAAADLIYGLFEK